MSKEELEKEAEEYAETLSYSYKDCLVDIDDKSVLKEAIAEAYLAGAEPREKQIDELKAQIKVLEQNLEDTEICENSLKNRIAELEEISTRLESYYQNQKVRIAELEAQIEKMKWHKVSDGDLPKVTGDYITNIGVLTYDHYGNNIYKWHTPFCEACDYGDEVDEDEVIAWCEIPKYTKEIKEK